MTTTHRPDAEDEIARVAYAIWEAEGRPEGRDRDHWERAGRLVEEGRAQDEFPESASADAGRKTAPRDVEYQDSAQTPSEKPGPRNPPPLPVTNTEGFVAAPESEEAAAGVPSADPMPPEAAAADPMPPEAAPADPTPPEAAPADPTPQAAAADPTPGAAAADLIPPDAADPTPTPRRKAAGRKPAASN